jgi:hypothetical protein
VIYLPKNFLAACLHNHMTQSQIMALHSNEAEKDVCEIGMAVDMQMCEVVELMTTSSDCLIREQRCGNVF